MTRKEKKYIEALERRANWLTKILKQNDNNKDLTEDHENRSRCERSAIQWALEKIRNEHPHLLQQPTTRKR